MPDHPVALAMIRAAKLPIAAPSANTSGRPSPTKAMHVAEDLAGRIDMILDGGTVGIGLESTIVDMTEKYPTILRPGYITEKMLEDVVGEVRTDPAIRSRSQRKDVKAKAPGMKYRHYAPKGQMTIVQGGREAVVDAINQMVREKKSLGCRVAVIATRETEEKYQCEFVRSIGSRQSRGSIAAGLYDILREMDHIGAEFIYAESFEEDELGEAIMNRMMKAAAYHTIHV
jgi:L-threonylcarbamoyladenylate synthase